MSLDYNNYDDCIALVDKVKREIGLGSNTGREYSKLIHFLYPKKLNSFIEIGSAYGASFVLWGNIIKGTKISVDLPINSHDTYPWPGDNTLEYILGRRKKMWEDLWPGETHTIVGNSRKQETIDEVKKILLDKKVDFLFIDAEHNYESVKKDYYNYIEFVSPGGYVGFHDIQIGELDPFGNEDNRNVNVFWEEISQQHESWVFVGEEERVYKTKIGLIKTPE